MIPYPHAKPRYYVEDIDDRELLVAVVLATYEGLKQLLIKIFVPGLDLCRTVMIK